jgi:predicted alpha/beta hydrolase family esterase
MKKVFIIHGFEGAPNGGWRPWLMGELHKREVYACALSMPNPEHPVCAEWVDEIDRHVERNPDDEIYLVGHSLGVPAILRYFETFKTERAAKIASAEGGAGGGGKIAGAVLISGPCKIKDEKEISGFLDHGFDFKKIKTMSKKFLVIHGDDDHVVPLDESKIVSEELGAPLVVIKGGRHLSGSDGWYTLPQCLDGILEMMK